MPPPSACGAAAAVDGRLALGRADPTCAQPPPPPSFDCQARNLVIPSGFYCCGECIGNGCSAEQCTTGCSDTVSTIYDAGLQGNGIWTSDHSTPNNWVDFDLGQCVTVTRIRLFGHRGHGRFPRTITVQAGGAYGVDSDAGWTNVAPVPFAVKQDAADQMDVCTPYELDLSATPFVGRHLRLDLQGQFGTERNQQLRAVEFLGERTCPTSATTTTHSTATQSCEEAGRAARPVHSQRINPPDIGHPKAPQPQENNSATPVWVWGMIVRAQGSDGVREVRIIDFPCLSGATAGPVG